MYLRFDFHFLSISDDTSSKKSSLLYGESRPLPGGRAEEVNKTQRGARGRAPERTDSSIQVFQKWSRQAEISPSPECHSKIPGTGRDVWKTKSHAAQGYTHSVVGDVFENHQHCENHSLMISFSDPSSIHTFVLHTFFPFTQISICSTAQDETAGSSKSGEETAQLQRKTLTLRSDTWWHTRRIPAERQTDAVSFTSGVSTTKRVRALLTDHHWNFKLSSEVRRFKVEN